MGISLEGDDEILSCGDGDEVSMSFLLAYSLVGQWPCSLWYVVQRAMCAGDSCVIQVGVNGVRDTRNAIPVVSVCCTGQFVST